MKSGTINKQSLLVRFLNRPTRKATRDFLHVLLRITAVDAERMQLHQLARVIFVEATVDPGGLVAFGWIRTRHARAPVVEIEKHRRRVRGGAEQIAKASHRKRPNRLSIECGEQISIVVFVCEDAEMVLPKIDHQLIELLVAVNRAQK